MTLTETVDLNTDVDKGSINDADLTLIFPSGEAYQFGNVQPDASYYIGANTPDVRIVSREAMLPPKPNILNVSFEENGGKDKFGTNRSAVDITFEDIPCQVNYYKVRLCIETDDQTICPDLQSNDPSAQESSNFLDLIISDSQFDGQELMTISIRLR